MWSMHESWMNTSEKRECIICQFYLPKHDVISTDSYIVCFGKTESNLNGDTLRERCNFVEFTSVNMSLCSCVWVKSYAIEQKWLAEGKTTTISAQRIWQFRSTLKESKWNAKEINVKIHENEYKANDSADFRAGKRPLSVFDGPVLRERRICQRNYLLHRCRICTQTTTNRSISFWRTLSFRLSDIQSWTLIQSHGIQHTVCCLFATLHGSSLKRWKHTHTQITFCDIFSVRIRYRTE